MSVESSKEVSKKMSTTHNHTYMKLGVELSASLELFILKVKLGVELSMSLELFILKVSDKLVYCYKKSVYARFKEEKRKKSTQNFFVVQLYVYYSQE